MEKYSERMANAIEDCVNAWSQVQEEAIKKGLERLAAYEDTGLEPEDLKKAFNEEVILKLAAQCLDTTPDHLRELLQAEKDGRLIVLPVALNEEIWVTAPHLPAPYRTIYVNADGILRDVERGYVFYKTREEAEAALKGGAE